METSSKGHSLSQLWEESVQTAQVAKPHTHEQQLELPLCTPPLLKVWLLRIFEPNTQIHWSHSVYLHLFPFGNNISTPTTATLHPLAGKPVRSVAMEEHRSPPSAQHTKGRNPRAYGGIFQ